MEDIPNSDKALAAAEEKAKLTPPTAPKQKKGFNDVVNGVGQVMGFVEKFLPIVKNAINDIDDIRSVLTTGQVAPRQRFQVNNQVSSTSGYYPYSRGSNSVVPMPSYMTRQPEYSPADGRLENFQTYEQAATLLANLKSRLERQTDEVGRNFVSLYDEYNEAGLSQLAQPTYYYWGWYDLRGADIRQMPNGNWALYMPPIKVFR